MDILPVKYRYSAPNLKPLCAKKARLVNNPYVYCRVSRKRDDVKSHAPESRKCCPEGSETHGKTSLQQLSICKEVTLLDISNTLRKC